MLHGLALSGGPNCPAFRYLDTNYTAIPILRQRRIWLTAAAYGIRLYQDASYTAFSKDLAEADVDNVVLDPPWNGCVAYFVTHSVASHHYTTPQGSFNYG